MPDVPQSLSRVVGWPGPEVDDLDAHSDRIPARQGAVSSMRPSGRRARGSVFPVRDDAPNGGPVTAWNPQVGTTEHRYDDPPVSPEVRADALTPEGQAKITEALSKPRNLSDRALELIDGDRQEVHGPPDQNLVAIGRVWSALLRLDDPIPAQTVALMMTGLKLVRATQGDGSLEHLVDACGYLELAERVRPLPMTDSGTGWFEGFVGGSDAGTQGTPGNRT